MTCGYGDELATLSAFVRGPCVLIKIGPGKRANADPALSNHSVLESNVPLILVTSENRSAQAAFEAYAGMRKHEVGRPSLRNNPHWQAAVAAAFARFEQEMGAGGA
jgi:hypothetical protein